MSQIIPIRNFKNTAEISEMCHITKYPIFVTKNGYGDMVIMSMEAYEEKLALIDMVSKIKAAESDVENGRVTDAFSSLKAIREKYNFSLTITQMRFIYNTYRTKNLFTKNCTLY